MSPVDRVSLVAGAAVAPVSVFFLVADDPGFHDAATVLLPLDAAAVAVALLVSVRASRRARR